MELAQLRAFVAASRERNIARAADSLRLTPSPVSRTIRQLETELGGDLFSRQYHDLELTDLGARLLPGAVEALDVVSELLRKAQRHPRKLRIGSTPWAPTRFAQELERRARIDGDPVDTTSALSSKLLHSMRHGELDVAIVHLPVSFAGIASRPLANYRFSVFADPTHEFGARSSIKLSDLAGTPILSMPHTMQPTAMSGMSSRLREAGLTDVTELDLQDWFTVPQVLRKTGGIMLGLRSASTPVSSVLASGGLISIPLADGELEFTLGLAWPEHLRDVRVSDLVEAMPPRHGQPIEQIE